jgi:DNA-binding NarL/FixJ family response regulator
MAKKIKKRKPYRVAVVDDQQLFRKGMVSLIEEYKDFEVVLEAANGKELIDWIRNFKPQVILLDVDMPIMNGIEVTEYLNKHFPDIKIIILTTYDDEDLIFHLAQKGAHGFLLKDSAVESVAEAIQTVMNDQRYFKDKISEKLMDAVVRSNKTFSLSGMQQSALSEREKEIVRLICKEHTTREIAALLNITPKTVEGHRENICQKIQARNVAGIVKYAVKHKLI